MPFTSNMTGTTELDSSLVLAFEQSFIVASGQENVMEQLAQVRTDIGAKSIQLTKYARLGLAVTPLSEYEDPASASMSDSAVILTPAEYGNVVTTTKLSSLQTGGKADLAAAAVVGINAGATLDKLALLALDASANKVAQGGAITVQFINKMYNKLARQSVAKINGAYVMIAHDDVIADLRGATGAGSWVDVVKYAAPGEVLANEVGMIGGFRVLRDNNATIAANGAGATDDSYNTYFLGANGLGKAVSSELSVGFNAGSDKMGRFAHVFWHTACAYGIVDADAVFVGQGISGVNA